MTRKPPKRPDKAAAKNTILLAGGNPQIAKADGDAAVRAYINAMPGWKRDVGLWLDTVIVQAVPGVRKAIRWNTPLYGVEGRGWFLGFHCLTKYVKVSFFRGSDLHPAPPGESKFPDRRYIDIFENDPQNKSQMLEWVKQAAALPGWIP